MAEAIGAVLAFAVGVGISPIPIVAGIVMLFSRRARVNGPLFLLGWLLGLGVVVTVVFVLADLAGLGADPTGTDASSSGGEGETGGSLSWLRLVAGVALLGLAGRTWRKRARPGEEPEPPRWMSGIDAAGPAKAFGLALALSANPKNLVLAAGAAGSLVAIDPATTEAIVALATFVVIGSAGVATSVAYDRIGGSRARQRLDDAKVWLLANNSAVMAVLFAVFGAVLVGQGLGRS